MDIHALDITGNEVSDISALAGFTFKTLRLGNNRINDISIFKTTEITLNLDLQGNPISDLSPLSGKKLRNLAISKTKVTDLSVLPKLPNLKALQIDAEALTPDNQVIINRLVEERPDFKLKVMEPVE